ncbi:tetratricopeptide repeat protein [Pedobacter sp. PWIIR3]
MDILYTVEEKYLQAVEELNYGELPKALRLFNEIIHSEPNYARAYYQLGSLYYSHFKDYQTAGYHFKKCIEMDEMFPEVYEHYLRLLITLKMHKSVKQIADKALSIPGVCKADIYQSLGLYAEELQDFSSAKENYRLALFAATCQTDHTAYEEHIKRVINKQQTMDRVRYTFQE